MLSSALEAIIIRHDREDSRYIALGRKYLSVCHLNLPDGEGTLIAPDWILTAAHVALDLEKGHQVTVNGKNYMITKVLIHPDYLRSRHDIALLKLNKTVHHVEPVSLYRETDEVGKLVTIVGGGDTGTGLTGPVRNDGKIRGAHNHVDEVNKAWIIFAFNGSDTALDLEGISGPGDSGGPAFIEKDGRLYVAGVSAIQSFAKQGLSEGRYGVLEYYTRVSSYLDWIDEALAEH